MKRNWRKTLFWGIGTALVIGVVVLFGAYQLFSGSSGLDRIHAVIEKSHKDVSHVEASIVQSMLHNDVVVFDVREKREYAVSHLPGAVRLSPNMKAVEFAKRYGDRIAGKKVVFYCSVGRRASRMISRVNDELGARGATAYNMTGGIFNWHNEERSLMRADNPTDVVHPFGKFLVPLLSRKDKVRFKVDP